MYLLQVTWQCYMEVLSSCHVGFLIGEIMCSVHSQVLEENQRTLQPGAVLVLRQVSIVH